MTCRRSSSGWRSPATASLCGCGPRPGDTSDSGLIRQVREDIRAWTLFRVIWVADRGFTSTANRRALMQGGGNNHRGEAPLWLRASQGRLVPAGPLRRGQGQHAGQGSQHRHRDRFAPCFNPAQAERDAAIRGKLVTQLEELIKDTDTLPATERARIEGSLAGKPGLKRFLRTTPGGLLRIDKQKIKTEANLDGKYLLRCSDPHLSAGDIALGYKQLLEVERGWRDMKQVLDLRPVYHRREDRIRAHVVLCWLALLLIRVIETRTGQTWNRARAELQRMHAVTWAGPAHSGRPPTQPSPSATSTPRWAWTCPRRSSPSSPPRRRPPNGI